VRKTKQVIIGNSAAALSALRAIRKNDCSSSVTLVSAEDCDAYSPVLTTYYISHKITRRDLFIADAKFYRDYDIQTKLGSKVIGIETNRQKIHMDDNSIVEYDNLLIATGASPRMEDNIDAEALEYVSSLRTIKDADKIIKISEQAKDIVIIGAGLVSLQIAGAVLREGVKVTLVVGSNQVLSQNLDAKFAAVVQERLESQGIVLLFNQRVQAITRENDRACVYLESGEKLRADLVAVGKGLNPNIEFITGSDIKVNRGVLVDDLMKTSIENIFAAGDVAEGHNSISGRTEVIATWPNACTQGEVAGYNMAGYPTKRESQFKENITTVMGLPITSIGLSRSMRGDFEELLYHNPDAGVYRRILVDNNRVIGAVILGDVGGVGFLRYCIEKKVDITPWREHFVSKQLGFDEIICQQLSIPKSELKNIVATLPVNDSMIGIPLIKCQ